MAVQREPLKDILAKINDLIAEHVGPVATLLSDESLEYWIAKLKKHQKQPSLRNIYIYISHLSQSIDHTATRQRFVDSVYDIDALSVYKPG